MNLRDQRQKEFADKWLETRSGILYLSPRFGKCLCSIKIMRELGFPKTLIIYPIETIRKSWENEFSKWEYTADNIEYCTTASLWKLAEDPKKYDLIIIDEVHMLSEANLKQLAELMTVNKVILGLSGTISDKTLQELSSIGLNVVAKYDIETAIREKVITDYLIRVVYCDLDNRVRFVQPSKKKPNFKVTEAERYDYLTRQINEIRAEVKDHNAMVVETGVGSFMNMSAELGLLPIQRLNLFKKSLGKLNATKALLKMAINQKQRALIFCGTIESADSLDVPVYHSKNKDPEVRDAFCRGEGDILATVDMFEAGVTVKPINVAIISSFDSNPETLAQRVSRLTGFEYDNPDKVAKIYIVCTENTVEIDWLIKALEFFDVSKIEYVTLKK